MDHLNLFSQALIQGDLNLIKSFPKSDLHNHGPLGSRLSAFSNWVGKSLPKSPENMTTLEQMDAYLIAVIAPHLLKMNGFHYAVQAAFDQAIEDGVTRLSMSIDCFFAGYFPSVAQFIEAIQSIYDKTENRLEYLPELGINRSMKAEDIERKVYPCLESGYFKSIDLYGVEVENDVLKFKELYRFAESLNIKRKAHCGEFLGANSIRETVELLQLQEVQHGITAVESDEVMNWLQRNKIQLNICPTSNVRLGRVESLEKHPIRKLADKGIPLTINSDDIMIFDQSVSEEYVNLFKAGLFSAEELNAIRLFGIN